MSVAVGIVLALTVAAGWLAALALMRLPGALDRLHAVSFLNAAVAGLVTLAAFLADGVSARSLKILVMMALLMLWGAALSHASGRAVFLREGRQEGHPRGRRDGRDGGRSA